MDKTVAGIMKSQLTVNVKTIQTRAINDDATTFGFFMELKCGMGESDPRFQIGNLTFYH